MIKSVYFPDKTFQTKEELFKELKENLEFITDAKKSEIQKSCEKGLAVNCRPLDLSKVESEEVKALKLDDKFYYIAVNSTLILDSHDDLHLNGIWKKSVSEQQGKNYLVCDHELEVLMTIARKEHIEMLVLKLPFSMLGKPYDGQTEVLIYKVAKNQIKIPQVKEWLDSGDTIEASVRMQYVDFVLCMDSNDPADEKEKENYDKYYPLIANKEDFEYIYYFFAIKEAKNVRESSLVVFGSNSSTGQLQKHNRAEKSLENPEPPQGTQSKQNVFIKI